MLTQTAHGLSESVNTEQCNMSVMDLIKATVVCGLLAFLVYEYPVVGQVVIIGVLSLLWLSYAYNTVESLRRRQS